MDGQYEVCLLCLSSFVNIFDTGESLVNIAMEIGRTYQWHILITNWVSYNNDNIDTWHQPVLVIITAHCASPDQATDILSPLAKNQIKSRSQAVAGGHTNLSKFITIKTG